MENKHINEKDVYKDIKQAIRKSLDMLRLKVLKNILRY